jgi:hypothetical protein
MTQISTELGLIVFIVAFFGIYIFLTSQPDTPSDFKFLSSTSLYIFTAGIPAIAGTCAVATGIPCAIGLGFYAVANLISAYYSSSTLIALIVMTPMMVGVIYIVSKLARGGG